jgi:hypothetical protein
MNKVKQPDNFDLLSQNVSTCEEAPLRYGFLMQGGGMTRHLSATAAWET